jgi:Xaa-Pro dipeptidase
MLRVDNETLKTRVHDIEEELRAAGLDGLVVYAHGSVLGNQSPTHGYLRFLCNFDGHNTPTILILRAGRAPTLISGNKPYLRVQAAEKSLWFTDIRHARPHLFGEEIVAVFGSGGPTRRRIAYLGLNETPAPVWRSLEKGLPGVDWVEDFAPRIDRYRVCKKPLEMTFHRHAAKACDAVFQTLAHEVKTGKPGYRIQAAMEHTARDAGCDYCITWLTVLPRADFARYNREECLRVPQRGDQVLAGILLTYDGHWGHAVRTGTVGKAADDHQRVYDVCREMYEAALERLRPGADLCEVNAAMDGALHKHYAEDDVRRSRAGHGLGYSYEDPVLTAAFPNPWDAKGEAAAPRDPLEIRPGMLMELHPNLFVPGVAGAMIGDMVAVTQTGYEVLTEYPRDLITW